jgi:hypothetical protein
VEVSKEIQDERTQTTRRVSIAKNPLEQQDSTWMERLSFTVGVLNVGITTYILGAFPTKFYLWYTPKAIILITLRWLEFRRQKSHSLLFDFCYSTRNISDMVSRAQLALLNPAMRSDIFVSKKIADPVAHEEKGQLQFTRNVVCVDVKGPSVSNLTLIDLPGIIRSSDRPEERKNIGIVKSVINEYISKPNAIIVCCVSMKQEMENTVVREMARRVDPTGTRTLGVLTKPDRVEVGTEAKKLDVIYGRSYALKLGYWVVKNRTPEELQRNISFDAARESERKFFATTEMFSSLPAHLKSQLGISNLELKLTPLLTQKIVDSLPGLRKMAQALLDETRLELSKLPPQLSFQNMGARMGLINLVREFTEKICQHINARVRNKKLWGDVQQAFAAYWRTLQDTRPSLRLGLTDDGMDHIKRQSLVVFHAESKQWCPAQVTEVEWSTQSPEHTRVQVQFTNFDSKLWIYRSQFLAENKSLSLPPQCESRRGCSNLDEQFLQLFKFTKTGTPPPETMRPGDERRTRTLESLHKIISESRGRQLPGDSPYEAKTRLIDEFLQEWREPTRRCVVAVGHTLSDLTQEVVAEMFHRFQKLKQLVSTCVDDLQRDLEAEVIASTETLLAMEMNYPFTLSLEDFENNKMRYMADLEERFIDPPLPPIESPPVASADGKQTPHSAATVPARAPVVFNGEQLRRRERDKVALRVHADVAAYFEIASKRFGDCVPMTIDHSYLLRFGNRISDELLNKLGICDAKEEELLTLLDEDEVVMAKRKELTSREDRLNQVRRELADFGAVARRWI